MTGDVREEQKSSWGSSTAPVGNGKSVPSWIPYSMSWAPTRVKIAGMDTFTESGKTRDGGAHSEDVARLAGPHAWSLRIGNRAGAALERTARAGADRRRQDHVRADCTKHSFEFQPQCKLVFSGNHKPALRNVGDNFRRRFNIIPFLRKPEVVDKELRSKLWDERDGILYWFLVGCIEWQCDGLQPPESVRAATSEYFENQDILGQWIIDCCEPGESTIRTLYKSYRTYCEGLHEFALRQGEFKDAITSRPGIETAGYKTAPVIKGIRVRVSESTQSAHNARFPDSD